MKKLSIHPIVVGTFRHQIDVRGRLTLPMKWRAALAPSRASRVVMFMKSPPCLALMSESRFQDFLESSVLRLASDEEVRIALRILAARTWMAGLDERGRLKIPETLRSSAGLKRDVVLVGCFNIAEVWDADRWEKQSKVSAKDFNAAARRIGLLSRKPIKKAS